MPKCIRVAMAQLNLLVGDLEGNAKKIIDASISARDNHRADVVVFPELTLTSYPPEDLLLREDFLKKVRSTFKAVVAAVSGIDVIIGYPDSRNGQLFNSAALIRGQKLVASYDKIHLPNYGVFDEKRYFSPGEAPCVVSINGIDVGITICEDIWQHGPFHRTVEAGAQIVINLNASPFHRGKREEREAILRQRCTETGVPIIYVNLIGGQDELVFDGGSMVVNSQGDVIQRADCFAEGIYCVDISCNGDDLTLLPGNSVAVPAPIESIYRALVLGVQDYIDKNGFQGVVIGLSGGIDSALTLAIAVDAIGSDRVEAVLMSSRYTAEMSVDDAKAECEALGVQYRMISIEPVFRAFLESLREEFAGKAVDVTEENIQARCRGIILMAISNKFRKLVLTTGNKSEMSVGYATLYGDMAGGFAPIKDVLKTIVYQLAEYRNSLSSVIPQRVIDRPPSAELAEDQRDEDSLPAYDILDPILEQYIEQGKSIVEIVDKGFDRQTVERVAHMVNRNEYKRRQAPPGIRITRLAFGRDRRYPITAKKDYL